MRITCPHCGARGNHEFSFIGDASLVRPAQRLGDPGESAASRQWMDYVYWRKNWPGQTSEYWYHAGGCRACLVLERNAETHEIISVRRAS